MTTPTSPPEPSKPNINGTEPTADAVPHEIHQITSGLPLLVTMAQLADFLHVTTRTLRRWSRTGRLRTFRMGTGGSARVVVARSEVARLLVAMRQERPSG